MLDEHNITGKKNISLTSSEKKEIKDRILFFMRTHPQGSVQPSPFYKDSLFVWGGGVWFTTGKFVAAAVVVMFVGSGVLAASAENSLPKDALYPFKINVNEKVLSWFAQSDAAEANFETSLATERLKEAEKLAVRGELDEKTAFEAEARFITHADKARSAAKNLESHDSDSAFAVHASLDSSLDAHGTILTRVFGENSGTATENIKSSVKSRKSDQGREGRGVSLMSAAKVASPASLGNDHSVSEQALPDAGNEKAALSARDYASGRLKKAESRFNKKRKTLNLENQAEIERHFEEANKFRTLASVEYDAGAFGESVSHYKKAANEADYIYIVLQAKDDLKFDVIRGITEEAKVETVKGDASSEVTEPVEGASKSEKSLDATRENPTKVRNKERNSDQADQESVTSER